MEVISMRLKFLPPQGNGLLANVLSGPLRHCIWSMKSDHSSLVEESKPSAPSDSII